MVDVFIGKVEASSPDKNAYRVAPEGGVGRSIWARPMDNGTQRPYAVDEKVVYADTSAGRIIFGKVPSPVREKDGKDIEKRPDEIQAEIYTAARLRALQGSSVDGAPNYRPRKMEAFLPGDVGIEHPDGPGFVGLYKDGTAVLDTGALASLLMCGGNGEDSGKVNLTAGSLRLKLYPGLEMEIGLKEITGTSTLVDNTEEGEGNFTAGVDDMSRERPKVLLKSAFFGDPDEQEVPDLYMEAGRCPDLYDWGNAISPRTLGKRLKRGFRFRIGGFADLEIDLERKEFRFTMADDAAPSPFQFRINPDEAVLTRGSQFISFNDKGIFLKGNVIGLAGPWTMWSAADLAGFTHQAMPQTRTDGTPFLSTACEWKDAAAGAGVKFVKSAYFGKNEEPAVLQNFLSKTYSRLARDLAQHQHQATAIGSPTSPPLPKPLADWVEDSVIYSNPTGTTYMDQTSKIVI